MSTFPGLRQNVGSLFLVQIANYLVPLLVLPYLLRVLGPDGFGQLAFVLAGVQYLVILTDFGFNLSASRQIAAARDNPAELHRLFWSTTLAKCLIGFVSVAIGAILVVSVPSFRDSGRLYLIGCIAVLGTVMLPAWWFQGNERLQLFAFGQLAARVVCAVCIFVAVRQESDLGAAVFWQSAPLAVAGIATVWFARVPRGLARVGWKDVLGQVRSGWNMFIATSSISLYTTSNVFVLGIVASPAAVGFFSFVERVVRACAGLITPVVQSVYPRLFSMDASGLKSDRLLRWSFVWLMASSGLCSIGLVLFRDTIVAVLGGSEFEPSGRIFLLMSAMPLLLALTSYLGTLRMAIMGLDRSLARILLVAGIGNFALVWVLGSVYEDIGAAVSVVVTEILISVAMVVVLRRKSRSILGLSPS